MEESNNKDQNLNQENGEGADNVVPISGGGSPANEDQGNDVQKEFDAIQKELLYLRAEFDNFRKRMVKEQEQSIRFGNERLIRELLTVVDLFDRGLAHGNQLATKAGADKELTNFVSGIQMTQRELVQVLSRFGVELIGTVGEKFDPNRHEAISQLEGAEYSEDSVAQVFQKGCLLHGRLLSPAKVAVGKPKA